MPLPDLITSFNLNLFNSYVFIYPPTALITPGLLAGQFRGENPKDELRNMFMFLATERSKSHAYLSLISLGSGTSTPLN